MNEENIKEIAIQARAWAESYQLKNSKHFPECLSSLCAIASSYLSHQLTQNNIENSIAFCDTDRVAHFFVICQDKVIDITATQFSSKLKPVEIRDLDTINLKDTNFWEATYVFNSPIEILEYQKQTNWFKEQRVDNCKELNLKSIPKTRKMKM
jgi:hypothetical protein